MRQAADAEALAKMRQRARNNTLTVLLILAAGCSEPPKTGQMVQTVSGLVHLHGIVMTLWFALFVVQTRLIAAHRTDLHRRVGVFGALLVVLAPGCASTREAKVRGDETADLRELASGVEALALFPLINADNVIGVLALGQPRFADSDIARLAREQGPAAAWRAAVAKDAILACRV